MSVAVSVSGSLSYSPDYILVSIDFPSRKGFVSLWYKDTQREEKGSKVENRWVWSIVFIYFYFFTLGHFSTCNASSSSLPGKSSLIIYTKGDVSQPNQTCIQQRRMETAEFAFAVEVLGGERENVSSSIFLSKTQQNLQSSTWTCLLAAPGLSIAELTHNPKCKLHAARTSAGHVARLLDPTGWAEFCWRCPRLRLPWRNLFVSCIPVFFFVLLLLLYQ